MEKLSRRDFFKFSALTAGASLLPQFMTEAKEATPPPMTDLPVFWLEEAPVKATYLKRNGSGRFWYGPRWNNVSGIPLDVLTPIRTVHYSQLEDYPGDTPYEYALVSELPHFTGSPAQWETIVGWADREHIRFFNGSLQGKEDGIVSTYSYGEQRDLYANKVWNVLLALEGITRFMKDNGPLVLGRDYSMLEMSNLIEDIEERHIYRDGLTAIGGGVCSVASTLSKVVFLAGARGYTEEVRRIMHVPYFEYWAPPAEPGITKENTDATVAYFSHSSRPFDPNNLDYIFRLRPDSPALYLSVKAHLAHDPEPKYGDLTLIADTQMIFSLTLKTTPVFEDEESLLANLRQDYADFHGFDEEIIVP